MARKIILFVFIAAIAGGLIGYYMYQKPLGTLDGEKSVESMSSEALFDAFEANESESMQRWGGKVIEITGTIAEVLANEDGSTTLILATSDPLFGVKCKLDPSLKHLNIFSSSQEVRLKGLCIGMNGDVEIDRCIIL